MMIGLHHEGLLARQGLPAPQWGQVVAFADLNGDGRADYLSGSLGWLTSYLQGEDGRFTSAASWSAFPIDEPPLELLTGDVNGDGRGDVVSANDRQLTVFFGLGNGSFRIGPSSSTVEAFRGQALADLNGDGHGDLVGSGAVRMGGGDGFFGPAIVHGHGGPLVVRDFDGNGVFDIAVAETDADRVVILTGNGDGTFATSVSHAMKSPFAIASHDLNHDTLLDIVVTSPHGATQLLLGSGVGAFEPQPACGVGGTFVAATDLDADGNLEVTIAGGSVLTVLPVRSDGVLLEAVSSRVPVVHDHTSLAKADVDRDGDLDIIVSSDDSTSVLLGAGDGTFPHRTDYAVGGASRIGDIDNDGHLDLVLAAADGNAIRVLRGNGRGTFGEGTPVVVGSSDILLAVDDLNDDGVTDLLTAARPDVISVWCGDGRGGFHSAIESHVPDHPFKLENVVAGDFNADGRVDVAVANVRQDLEYYGELHRVSVGSSNGTGTFGWTHLVEWREGDISDGWRTMECSAAIPKDEECGDVAVFGGRSWYLHERITGYVGWVGWSSDWPLGEFAPVQMAGADFDGDGRTDLAVMSYGVLHVLYRSAAFDDACFVGGGIFEVGDFNGDGRTDVAVARGSAIALLLNQKGVGPPDAPSQVTARAGDGAIKIEWAPIEHPRLAGYRIHYGLTATSPPFTSDLAAEGPSGISVPPTASEYTLHCLPDSMFSVRIGAIDLDGDEACSRTAKVRPRPVGGELSVSPKSWNDAARGWLTVSVQPSQGYSARDIVTSSVTVNGAGPAERSEIVDRDHDGVEELVLRFSRHSLPALPQSARWLGLEVRGLLLGCMDTLRIAVNDSIRSNGYARVAGLEEDHVPVLEGTEALPTSFAVRSISPNPISTGCDIAFDLPETAPVVLQVFAVDGRLVKDLVGSRMSAGRHRIHWDRGSTPQGIYFIRLKAGTFNLTRRVALLR